MPHKIVAYFLAIRIHMTNIRQLLTVKDALLKMARYKSILGEEYSAGAYSKAADIITTTDILDKVIAGKPSDVRGIGQGIHSFISEIIATGSSKEMSRMRADDRIRAAETLEEIIGVGPMTAAKWVLDGTMTVDDARKRTDLTALQKIGLSVYGKVMKRVPRDVVESVFKRVAEVILGRVGDDVRDGRDDDGHIRMMLTGSYRRGAKDSGDVDILIVVPDGYIIPANSLSTPDHAIILTAGEMKTSYLVTVGDMYAQVDIFVASAKTYVPYILYSTGSADHNIYIRGLAKSKGMHLTQYALTKDGKEIPLKTEEDLYNILGIDYVPPEKR